LQHQGVGTQLMNIAKEQARKLKCRVIMLETQSCNTPAIAFYLSQGFEFFGFDRSAYGNNDVEKCEVRLELGQYI
jgi:ribosomal protein S18 acetylase RimI-like enzyme